MLKVWSQYTHAAPKNTRYALLSRTGIGAHDGRRCRRTRRMSRQTGAPPRVPYPTLPSLPTLPSQGTLHYPTLRKVSPPPWRTICVSLPKASTHKSRYVVPWRRNSNVSCVSPQLWPRKTCKLCPEGSRAWCSQSWAKLMRLYHSSHNSQSCLADVDPHVADQTLCACSCSQQM